MLLTHNLYLTTPVVEDLSAIVNFERRNKAHLEKWEPALFFNEEEAVQKRLENWIKECEEGKAVRFFMRPKEAPECIIGFCNFTQIFHGPFRACYLGYKIDYEYEGKGLMFEALEKGIKYIFEELGLHRIMANYMPINIKSAKLLNRLGFVIEGYAKNYLLINTRWEDHVLTALSFERWQSKKSVKQNTDEVILREVELSDGSFLSPLMGQLGYPIEEHAMKENIQKYCLLPSQKAWVAEIAGKVVGCIAVSVTNYFHRPGSFLRVITMIVDQKNRRTGVGKKLLNLAEKFACEQGCSHVELTSGAHRAASGAHAFYESLGYSELGNQKKYFGKKL